MMSDKVLHFSECERCGVIEFHKEKVGHYHRILWDFSQQMDLCQKCSEEVGDFSEEYEDPTVPIPEKEVEYYLATVRSRTTQSFDPPTEEEIEALGEGMRAGELFRQREEKCEERGVPLRKDEIEEGLCMTCILTDYRR